MNLPENAPDWTSPDWKPVAYPQKDSFSFRPATPEEDEANAKLREAQLAYTAEAAKRWPDLPSYCKMIYEERIENRPSGQLPIRQWFEPKRLVPPGGYHSPKVVSAMLYSTLFEVAERDRRNLPIMPTEVTLQSIYYRILNHQVPIFYFAEDFVRAVAATDLPKDIFIGDIHWPMPAMVFAFPNLFMRSYTGRDVTYVYGADFPSGEYRPPAWLPLTEIGARPIIATPDRLAFAYQTREQGVMGGYVTALYKKDLLRDVNKYGYTDYTNASPAQVASDDEQCQLVVKLVLKLLVVLSTRQQYIERDSIQRPAKKNQRTGKQEQHELWTPNMVGFHFKPQRLAQEGIHASPHWHWRRGHVTHQRHGPVEGFISISTLPRISEGPDKGEVNWLDVSPEMRAAFWACHQRHWLEPMLINFDEPQACAEE